MGFADDDPFAQIERSIAKRERRLQAPRTVSGKTGAVVRCDLAGALDHTGILVDDDTIIELDGTGLIRIVTYAEFLMSSVYRSGEAITVACDDDLAVLSDLAAASRAINFVGKSRTYHLLLDNCHQFVSGCITGDFENDDKLFSLMELTISERLNNHKPVVWWPLQI
ncbi:MAG: hypothetical protein H7338_00050 [Candidatus Sericytochromatia bacterium]|nr:hypothetical protein [Candidatus Sericytochromatia bacterium]